MRTLPHMRFYIADDGSGLHLYVDGRYTRPTDFVLLGATPISALDLVFLWPREPGHTQRTIAQAQTYLAANLADAVLS